MTPRRLGGRLLARAIGTTISYIDSQAARTSFALRGRRSGVKLRGRCVASTSTKPSTRATGCTLYVRVGGFAHTDVAGRNRVRFAGIRGLRLAPGKYRLDVTPSANRHRGATVSASFTIIR